jgi:signal peptidase I
MLAQFTQMPARQVLPLSASLTVDGRASPQVHSTVGKTQRSFAMIICTAFSLWKGLGVFMDTPSPIVVVLSGSMEPVFHRGDILLLNNRKKAIEIGDVVVYNVNGRDIPIVHRVIKQHWTDKHSKGVEKQYLLTKGDNNPYDDVPLYSRGKNYLDRQEEIMGTIQAYDLRVCVLM